MSFPWHPAWQLPLHILLPLVLLPILFYHFSKSGFLCTRNSFHDFYMSYLSTSHLHTVCVVLSRIGWIYPNSYQHLQCYIFQPRYTYNYQILQMNGGTPGMCSQNGKESLYWCQRGCTSHVTLPRSLFFKVPALLFYFHFAICLEWTRTTDLRFYKQRSNHLSY